MIHAEDGFGVDKFYTNVPLTIREENQDIVLKEKKLLARRLQILA